MRGKEKRSVHRDCFQVLLQSLWPTSTESRIMGKPASSVRSGIIKIRSESKGAPMGPGITERQDLAGWLFVLAWSITCWRWDAECRLRHNCPRPSLSKTSWRLHKVLWKLWNARNLCAWPHSYVTLMPEWHVSNRCQMRGEFWLFYGAHVRPG